MIKNQVAATVFRQCVVTNSSNYDIIAGYRFYRRIINYRFIIDYDFNHVTQTFIQLGTHYFIEEAVQIQDISAIT